jgi:hypothetical protein
VLGSTIFMKTLSALATAAALMVVAATAQAAPSGNTCTYAAGSSGTAYTVSIITGAGVQQYGFAFSAPGTTIKNISISGRNGSFTTSNLPAGSNGAWASDDPSSGTVSATLTLSGKPTGAIVVRPSESRASATATGAGTYYDAVTCTATKAAPAALSFSVNSRATYVTSVRGWHLVVTVPTAATVSAKQAVLQSIDKRVQSLVQAKQLGINSQGKVTLTLKPTPKGLTMLTAQKLIKVSLMVTVDASDGRQAHKTVSLTLRK